MFRDFIKRYWRIHLGAYFDDRVERKDKDAFRVSGTQIYIGRQGSGKTISAVNHVLKIKQRYPKAILVTNVKLNVDWDYIHFDTAEEFQDLLINLENDKFGIIYLIDEIHTYFNALESKGIPPYIFTEISQQRKQRKTIIGTSQLFMRLAKPFREQCDTMVSCRTMFGVVTFQRAYDGMELEQDFDGSLIGEILKRGFFWHSRELRSVFDTFQKVVSAKGQMLQFDHVTKYEGTKKRRSY